jgi:hypothetical protein
LDPGAFNHLATLPYGCTVEHIHAAMGEFVKFLGFLNRELVRRHLPRLEGLLMPANFSSIVGEFLVWNLPRFCSSLAKNAYHNGHPDLLPKGRFSGDMAQHASEGIEVKASRYFRGWQGHNPEDTWLLVFVFDSNRPKDSERQARPFSFQLVAGAKLLKNDWLFAGRSATSRRTITASVTRSGHEKLMSNWIYKAPKVRAGSVQA